jgi:hypothetical protein
VTRSCYYKRATLQLQNRQFPAGTNPGPDQAGSVPCALHNGVPHVHVRRRCTYCRGPWLSDPGTNLRWLEREPLPLPAEGDPYPHAIQLESTGGGSEPTRAWAMLRRMHSFPFVGLQSEVQTTKNQPGPSQSFNGFIRSRANLVLPGAENLYRPQSFDLQGA